MSVKKIAGTVAAIVVIGAIVSLVTGNFLSTWIGQVWDIFIDQIETVIGSNKQS